MQIFAASPLIVMPASGGHPAIKDQTPAFAGVTNNMRPAQLDMLMMG